MIRLISICSMSARSPRIQAGGGASVLAMKMRRRRACDSSSAMTSRQRLLASSLSNSISRLRTSLRTCGDDAARAQAVATDVGEDLPDLAQRRIRMLEQDFPGIGIAQDRAQRLVDFVRQRRRELAHDRQPRCVDELLLLPLHRHVAIGYGTDELVRGGHDHDQECRQRQRCHVGQSARMRCTAHQNQEHDDRHPAEGGGADAPRR